MSQDTPWVQYLDDESGLYYYFNEETQVTQWHPPASYRLDEEDNDDTVARAPISAGSSSSSSSSANITITAPTTFSGRLPAMSPSGVPTVAASGGGGGAVGGGNTDDNDDGMYMGRVGTQSTSVAHDSTPFTPLETETLKSNKIKKTRTWFKRQSIAYEDADEQDKAGMPKCYVNLTRALLCTLAIALLWFSSLAVSSGIADYFLESPNSQAVFDSWNVVADITLDEKRGHERCAREQTLQCQTALDVAASEMVQRSNNSLNGNDAKVASARNASTLCEIDLRIMYDATGEYLSSIGFTADNPNLSARLVLAPSCTEPVFDNRGLEQPNPKGELLRSRIFNFGSNSEQAFTQSTEFVSVTNSRFRALEANVAARVEYDKTYLADKTNVVGNISLDLSIVSDVNLPNVVGTIDLELPTINAVDCLANISAPCAPAGSIVKQYKETQDAVAANLALYEAAVDNNLQSARNQFNDVKNKAEDIKVIVDWALDAASFIRGLSGSAISVPDNSLFTLALTNTNLLRTLPVDVILSGLPNVTLLPPEIGPFFSERFPAILDGLVGNITEQRAALQAAAEEWARELNQTLPPPNLFEDYNPPEVIVAADQQEEDSDEFLRQQAEVLNQEQESIDEPTNISATVTAFFSSGIAERSNFTFTFQEFGGSLSFYPFIDAIGTVTWFFFLLDYLFRFYKSIRLIVRYWTQSAVGLPIIDVRKFKTDKSTPIFVRLARVATNRFVVYSAALVLFGVAVAAIINAYQPVWDSYNAGCVNSNDGTVVTTNAFSFTYNFASTEGNSDLADGLDRYDATRSAYCFANGQRTVERQTQQEAEYSNAEAAWLDAQADVDLFRECVLEDTFADPGAQVFFDVYQNALLLDQFPLRDSNPFLYARGSAVCFDTRPFDAELENGVFNCTDLPPCVTTCTGPNEALLLESTHVAGCRSESLMHAAIFQTFVAVLVFVCLNISRLFLMAATSRLYWRSLTPYGFSFLGSCSRTGKTTVDVKKELMDEVYKSVLSYERVAALMIIVAILIHLPYVIVLSVVPNPVVTSPSTFNNA